jgi:hypothetical protein
MKRSPGFLVQNRLLVALFSSALLGGGACLPQQSQKDPEQSPAPTAQVPAKQPAAEQPGSPARPDEEKGQGVREDSTEKNPPPLLTVSRPKGTKDKLDLKESFDNTKAGKLPSGWTCWNSNGSASFQVAEGKALSLPNGLSITAGSNVAARAWVEDRVPADVQVSAAIFLDTLIPAEVFLRGAGLATAQPTYYAVRIARGLEVQLVRVVKGKETTLGSLKSSAYVSGKWVRVTLNARDKNLHVQVVRLDTAQYLDGSGQWQETTAWAMSAKNDEITGEGMAGVGRVARYGGTLVLDDFALGKSTEEPPVTARPPVIDPGKTGTDKKVPPTVESPPPAELPPLAKPLPRPEIPRHYPHIRIAMLAYWGNPMGSFEDKLLRNSVDLVVPHTQFLKHINAVAPKTPQLIYTNTSNLYLDLLTEWASYADKKGVSREGAFFHAAAARPFQGDSPSSKPVTWFWGVYRGKGTLTDETWAARSKTSKVPFGIAGESVYVGYLERFCEINLDLISGAGGGWSAILEYPTAVDGKGKPATWATLTKKTDTTSGLKSSGQITFDPPADWKPAVVGPSAPLYFLRFRTVTGGNPAIARSLLGRDYVNAGGKTSGVVPAFDSKADLNKDGYLDDKEYANRAPGKDARFLYESRMPTESYGQMRFSANPGNADFRAWAVDYHKRLLEKHPLAAGFFMDNSEGRLPVKAGDVLEPVNTFAYDYGAMLNAISKAIAPRWVLANTAGGQAKAEPVIQQNPIYFEEFAIRPMRHHYGFFEDLAATVARRSKLATPAPLAVLDSHPQNGSPTDARMLLGTLAYYYLLADPDSTFLMFYGGFEPSSTWQRHWTAAVAFDVGRPTGNFSLFASGKDPANPTLNCKVYQRPYQKALILYKPLSHARGAKATATLGDDTATKHELGGSYRPLRADGTLGSAVTSVSLRNGEGAILVKSGS